MNDHIPEITRFVLNNFPLAIEKDVQWDTDLLNEGIIDSLGLLSVISFVEELTQAPVSDEDVTSEHFGTISRINEYVQKHSLN